LLPKQESRLLPYLARIVAQKHKSPLDFFYNFGNKYNGFFLREGVIKKVA
jgi:hypothetical protein